MNLSELFDGDEKSCQLEFGQVDETQTLDETETQCDDYTDLTQLDSFTPKLDEAMKKEHYRNGLCWASHSRLNLNGENLSVQILGHTESQAKLKQLFLVYSEGFDTVCWEDAVQFKNVYPDETYVYEETSVHFLYVASAETPTSLNIFIDGRLYNIIQNPLSKQIGIQDVHLSAYEMLMLKQARMKELQKQLHDLSEDIVEIAMHQCKKTKFN